MSTGKKRMQMLGNIDRRMMREVETARRTIVGLEAILDMPRSKYHGRPGIITDVMPAPSGKLMACLMILNHKGTGYLNSEPATRQYRMMNELQFTGRRVFEPRRAA